MSEKKIRSLIVDTTAFIKAENLRELAENVYTIQEVIDEITNDRQRRKLVVLPYDLEVKTVFTENIKFVSDFAIKTGDYRSLSATDIKVIALTYQLEKEKVGIDHLKTEPTMQRTINKPRCKVDNVVDNSQDSNSMQETDSKSMDNSKSGEHQVENDDEAERILEQIKNMDIKDNDETENIMVKVSDDEEEETESESESDGEDWITPSNIKEKKQALDSENYCEDKSVEVACITSDFAMQNVLKQIGLNVTSVDGRIIQQIRTYIFRCTACFKTTSVMTKLFCPKCGNATLKKVAVSIDGDGNQHLHINFKKRLSTKGKRFSLPTPKGGQHFQYPIVTEDQHIHKRFATHMARKKNNPFDPDYIAGYSPFVMRDVNSKSAILGIRANKQDLKYWTKHHFNGKKK